MPVDFGEDQKPQGTRPEEHKTFDERVAEKKIKLEERFGPKVFPESTTDQTDGEVDQRSLISTEDERLARNRALAARIIDRFLDKETVKKLAEGSQKTIFFRTDDENWGSEPTFEFSSDMEAILTSEEPKLHANNVHGPIVQINLPRDKSAKFHTPYGDLPWQFADSTGELNHLDQVSYLSFDGQAFVTQVMYKLGEEASDDIPRFDFKLPGGLYDWNHDVRNFGEEDYKAVEEAINETKDKVYRSS